MSDKKPDADATPKKKGKGKLIVIALAGVVLVGGGVAGGLYAAKAGGGAETAHAGPQLVPKSEQVRAAAGGEGGDHGGGSEGGEGHASGGRPTPAGQGGDQYASTYYAMDKEFTSNLRDSVHFVQVGLAVSTPYDQTVIDNLKTNEIAVRSAILMALGDTTEEQVFTSDGKQQLQKRLVQAINAVLKQKEGFGGISNAYFTSFVVQ
jgi:flagellar protein FliL